MATTMTAAQMAARIAELEAMTKERAAKDAKFEKCDEDYEGQPMWRLTLLAGKPIIGGAGKWLALLDHGTALIEAKRSELQAAAAQPRKRR